jgi:hypothetical protein
MLFEKKYTQRKMGYHKMWNFKEWRILTTKTEI